MPIKFQILTEEDIALFKWEGVVTSNDYLATLESYLSDPDFRVGRPELIDLSDLKDFQVSFARMVSLNHKIQPSYSSTNTPTKIVVYAPNETIFGIARMMQQLVSDEKHIKVVVYREKNEALHALSNLKKMSIYLLT